MTVAAGDVRDGLDINDWYYDPQAFPPPMPPRTPAPTEAAARAQMMRSVIALSTARVRSRVPSLSRMSET